jgi:hypothetical protein
MGARPTSFKRGGGFLNGVDGVISGYQFTDEFNGEPFKPGKFKGNDGKMVDRPHSLNCLLSVRVDGADDDISTTLKVANDFDAWEVSDDGYVITPTTEGQELGASAAFSKFISSLVEAGFPIANLPEDDFDFRAIIGTRVRFVQRTDAERTKQFGKRKAKNGKEYERQDLVVDQVYDLPTTEAKSNGKAAKPNGKAAKPAGKAAKAANGDAVKELATETLTGILADNDGEILKAKMGMKILLALKGHDLREDVRKYLFDDSNLTALQEDGVITYNKAKQLIAAA